MGTQLEPQRQVPTCQHCQDIEAKMRLRALTLANSLLVTLVTAHIFFEWNGRHLPIPDVVYAAMLTPWAGAAVWKILKWVKR